MGGTLDGPLVVALEQAVAALTGDQTAVSEMLAAFAERRDLVLRGLRSMPGVNCGRPMGAFYAFPSIAGVLNDDIATSDDLATHLIDTANVVTVPGTAFGRDGFLRISFAVEVDSLREALDRGYDCVVLEDCCGAVTTASHERAMAMIKGADGVFGTVATAQAMIDALD